MHMTAIDSYSVLLGKKHNIGVGVFFSDRVLKRGFQYEVTVLLA